MNLRKTILLAGDVGGTKTNLAIFAPDADPQTPLMEATFASAHYPDLESIIAEFLARTDVVDGARALVGRACFGVAGPVLNGQATITNLPWVIDEAQLQAMLETPAVRLLNDLVAVANAVPHLPSHDLYTLNQGQPVRHGVIAIIAPGTGLGEAYLAWDGKRYRPYPSEGGHADFAPQSALETGLLHYLQETLGLDHISYERVCSGQGFANIYAYLKASGYAEEPDWLAKRLTEAADPAPVIVAAALDDERPCELCRAALDLFTAILGAEAGNLALKVLATGGVYLGGGIPPRMLAAFQKGRFLEMFCRKGRLSDLLTQMPVHVILNPRAALLGAARYGFDML